MANKKFILTINFIHGERITLPAVMFVLRNKMKENVCVTNRTTNFVTFRPIGGKHVFPKNSVSELLQVDRGWACDHMTWRQALFLGLAILSGPLLTFCVVESFTGVTWASSHCYWALSSQSFTALKLWASSKYPVFLYENEKTRNTEFQWNDLPFVLKLKFT